MEGFWWKMLLVDALRSFFDFLFSFVNNYLPLSGLALAEFDYPEP